MTQDGRSQFLVDEPVGAENPAPGTHPLSAGNPISPVTIVTMAPSPSVAKLLALGLLAGAQFLVFLSINIPIVAVPAVANDLEIAPVNAQVVVTAYALA